MAKSGPPEIVLYELGPTRSSRVRWALLEADLPFESVGNAPEIIHSDALREVHPLGKLPAALIDGRPLFESAAIATAVADLVPEKKLVGASGTWARALHDQWVSFALTEMEAWVWSTELNTSDFVFPREEHVPDIVAFNAKMYRRGAAVLNDVLGEARFLVEDRFTVADVIVAYTVLFGEEFRLLEDFDHLTAYLDRLGEREHCTLPRG